MTERLSDVTERIASVNQLATVITAMRSVAAARSHEARAQLDGIRAYARIIADAIGNALAFGPPQTRSGASQRQSCGQAIVALCSEQGFCGDFNERVLDAVSRLQAATTSYGKELLLVGDRGLMVADEWGLAVNWSAPMVAHTAQVAELAGRIGEELYPRLDAGQISRVARCACAAECLGCDRHRRKGAGTVRFRPLSAAARRRAASGRVATAGTPGCSCRRICLRRTLRGNHAVLCSRERRAHAGDDLGAQQCHGDPGAFDGKGAPAPPGRHHQ